MNCHTHKGWERPFSIPLLVALLSAAAALPLSWLSALYLLLILLSGYAIINLVRRVDGTAVQHLQGRVAERLVGGVLVGLGALFFLRAVSLLGDALTGGSSLSAVELGVLVADLVISLLWVLGGVVLWRKRPLGYAAGGGLLFQANMLFVALLAFFMLQPFLADVPFPLEDFVVIFVMGLVCFIPLALFIRGAARGGEHRSN